jgi:hypothetical protein
VELLRRKALTPPKAIPASAPRQLFVTFAAVTLSRRKAVEKMGKGGKIQKKAGNYGVLERFGVLAGR